MSFGKSITLKDGNKIPQIGLGTWLAEPGEVEKAVEIAVRHGYRHLDLAMCYENQEEVGKALKKVVPSVVKREDLWLTSKLWNTCHRPDLVEKELDLTLKQLGVEYLDLYLMHWPVAFQPQTPGQNLMPEDPNNKSYVALDMDTSIVETWKAMIALPKSKVKSVGVSNFTIDHIEAVIKATGAVPAFNQVETHPLLPQDDLVKYCKEKGIQITAYSPLGNNMVGKPKLTENSHMESVAKKLNATPAQVAIAWGTYRGYAVIPKSVNEERIKQNFQQIELSKEDYEEISKVIGDGKARTRFNIPYAYYQPKWDINIYGEEEEKGAKHTINLGV
ncbi:hypothetical protein D9758_006691 [Tetrapyrgos nigripes]|uniref:NADP-dependent oxidoreductase domain-containing protein n=1 Tax=Tetrapyrgos nigripes TaxID=182062 RepID=A0A8H5GJN1_9AGAR|nr:hypothetical protein D9758_006691 [Tetrapyrgos nigripes]